MSELAGQTSKFENGILPTVRFVLSYQSMHHFFYTVVVDLGKNLVKKACFAFKSTEWPASCDNLVLLVIISFNPVALFVALC